MGRTRSTKVAPGAGQVQQGQPQQVFYQSSEEVNVTAAASLPLGGDVYAVPDKGKGKKLTSSQPPPAGAYDLASSNAWGAQETDQDNPYALGDDLDGGAELANYDLATEEDPGPAGDLYERLTPPITAAASVPDAGASEEGFYDNQGEHDELKVAYGDAPPPNPAPRSMGEENSYLAPESDYLAPVPNPKSGAFDSQGSEADGMYTLGGSGTEVARGPRASSAHLAAQHSGPSEGAGNLKIDASAAAALRKARQDRLGLLEQAADDAARVQRSKEVRLGQIDAEKVALERTTFSEMLKLNEQLALQEDESPEASENVLMHHLMLLQQHMHAYLVLEVEELNLNKPKRKVTVDSSKAIAEVKEMIGGLLNSGQADFAYLRLFLGEFATKTEDEGGEAAPRYASGASFNLAGKPRASMMSATSAGVSRKSPYDQFIAQQDDSVKNWRGQKSTNWLDDGTPFLHLVREFVQGYLAENQKLREFVRLQEAFTDGIKQFNEGLAAYLRALQPADKQADKQIGDKAKDDNGFMVKNPLYVGWKEGDSTAAGDYLTIGAKAEHPTVAAPANGLGEEEFTRTDSGQHTGSSHESATDSADAASTDDNPEFGFGDADLVGADEASQVVAGSAVIDANVDEGVAFQLDSSQSSAGDETDLDKVDLEQGTAAIENALFQQFFLVVQTMVGLVKNGGDDDAVLGGLTRQANEQTTQLLSFADLKAKLLDSSVSKKDLKTLFLKALATLKPKQSHRARNTLLALLALGIVGGAVGVAMFVGKSGGDDNDNSPVADAVTGQALATTTFLSACQAVGDIAALNLSSAQLFTSAAVMLVGQSVVYNATVIEEQLQGVFRWAGLLNGTATISDVDTVATGAQVFFDALEEPSELLDFNSMEIVYTSPGAHHADTKVLLWDPKGAPPLCEKIKATHQVLTPAQATALDVDVASIDAVNFNGAAERIPLGFTSNFHPATRSLFRAEVRGVVNGGLVHKTTGEPIGTLTSSGIYSIEHSDIANLAFNPADRFAGAVTPQLHLIAEQDGEVIGEISKSVTLNFIVPVTLTSPSIGAEDITFNEDGSGPFDFDVFIEEAGVKLTKTISDIPAGFMLTDGDHTFIATSGVPSVDVSDWDSRLTITSPADYNGSPLLKLTAKAELDDPVLGLQTKTTTDTLRVTVVPVADVPLINIASSLAATEDQALAIPVSFVVQGMNEAFVAQTVTGFPAGTLLTDGNLSFTVQSATVPVSLLGMDTTQLQATFPANYKGNSSQQLALTFKALVQEGSSINNAEKTVVINFTPVADLVPIVVAKNNVVIEAGLDGAPAPVNLGFTLGQLSDLQETFTARVSVVGDDVGSLLLNNQTLPLTNGVVDVDPSQVQGLGFQAVDGNHLGATQVTLAVTSYDGASNATSTASVNVQVALEAPEPPVINLDANDVVTDEDVLKKIPLNIEGADSVSIKGLPKGARLSDDEGNTFTAAVNNADVDITAWHLSELRVLPPLHADQAMSLKVVATVTENGVSSEASSTIVVSVNAVADKPTLTLPLQVSGDEDAAIIPLQIVAAEVDTDGSQTTTAKISGVSQGTLTHGSHEGGGVWAVPFSELSVVAYQPKANWSGTDNLTVSLSSQEAQNDDIATVSQAIAVNVVPKADTPTLVVPGTKTGNEDSSIAISDISGALTDTDGSENLTFEISGVLGTLSAGNKVGGVWILQPSELSGLSFTPTGDRSGTQVWSIQSVATEAANGDVAKSTAKTLSIIVNPVADTPNLAVSNVAGNEDSAINLVMSGSAKAGSGETVSYELTGVNGALNTGTNLGGGKWRLTQTQLNAGVRLTPSADFAGNIPITVKATSSDGASTTSISKSFTVAVAPVADTPNLAASNVSGNEDTSIALSITGSPKSGSGETVTYEISGVQGTLNTGTNLGGNKWRLTQTQLNSGVHLTPPADFAGNIGMSVKATSVHGASSTSVTKTFTAAVAAVADAPNLNVNANPSGDAESFINLGISGSAKSGSGETVTYKFTGVGGILNRGTNQGGGTWALTQADINAGVSYKGTTNDAITVTATSTHGSSTATTTKNINIAVAPIAHTPSLSVSSATGNENTQIPLSITAAAGGPGETLKVEISNVQGGALNQFKSFSGGVYDVTGKLSGLKFAPTNYLSGSYSFVVKATSTASNGRTATNTKSLVTTVNEIGHAPSVSLSSASGAKATNIALPVSVSFPDNQGENHYLDFTGVPNDVTFNKGSSQGGGIWRIPESAGFGGITFFKTNAGTFSLTAKGCAEAGNTACAQTPPATMSATGCGGRGCR